MTQNRLAGIRLNEGVTTINALAFYFLTFLGLPLMFFVSASQDFLLTTFLRVPSAEQGRVAGNLQTFREAVILVMIGLAGLLADKFGRKVVCVAGFLCLGVGYALFPFASTVSEVLPFYFISAIGAAFITGMMSTIFADYIFDQDRGKASGLQGILIGLSIPLVGIGLKALPKVFQNMGLGEIDAGRRAYYVVASMALVSGIILWLGLKQGRPAAVTSKQSFGTLIKEGIAAAREPGVALSYFSAFVSRSDLAVVGVFLTLWISKVGRAEGMDSATAASASGRVLAFAGIAYLISAPLVGLMADKVDRVKALIGAALLGFIAYTSALFVDNPLRGNIYVVVLLIGAAQIFGVITSQVLASQQAPPEIRGSVLGFFGLCGAAAQIILGWVGGQLFDHWREAGPFVLVGFFNLLLFLAALAMRSKVRVPAQTGGVSFGGGH